MDLNRTEQGLLNVRSIQIRQDRLKSILAIVGGTVSDATRADR
jgi:hypothetical protein